MKHVYLSTGHELKIPNIVDNEGVYLFDDTGNRYMDLESGTWCISVGHKNERINKAIMRQIGTVMHTGFCYSNQVLEESSKAVLYITNFGDGKCVFLCSGSEAIEISRQISKHLSGKNMSMTLHDSYLGAYASVTDRTRNWYVFDWERCKTCGKNGECDPSCDAIQDIPEEISDFIFEPGSSSGFVRFPPRAMIQNIVHRVRDNNGKIIANEVTTGIGRTGMWFGYQHYDIEPDFVAMGKGIGNGYPVSVAAINPTAVDELERRPFKYAQSHQNDPLGAAVVGEVIREIEENGLISRAKEKGPRFLDKLTSLVDNETILDVRGRGMMFAVDLVGEDTANEIYDKLIRRGYIVGNRGRSFRIDPPLILTETEFDGFIDAFEAILRTLKSSA
ncbi:MAG: aminotransferase class III-fold pyridoxal phosphate-dependent enzyme [Deltaproteobacteria bacterium]|nr:aminotransferase class III-fold pyridoxal phosphate-dependent enzyme [Candidatus Zymogenaceae bacterium]